MGLDVALIERLKSEIRYEFSREGPPEGFPKFPDLPAGRYRDPAFFDLEMQYMWKRTWLLANREEELPGPGYYAFWEHLDTPVLLVRGSDHRLRAFHNRSEAGGRLLDRPDESHLRWELPFDSAGNNLKVQQEFPRRCFENGLIHDQQTGRTYNLEGQAADGKSGALDEIRCETWHGFVMINQDSNAMPVVEWMGPWGRQMEQFGTSTWRTLDKRWTIIPCNWKVTVEAFQEVYHFKHIHHKGGVSALDQRGATMGTLVNGHSRMITPLSRRMAEMSGMADVLDWREGISRGFGGSSPVMPLQPGIHPMVSCTSSAWSLFPNWVSPVSTTGFPALLAWPIDVRTTCFEWITFVPDWGDKLHPGQSDAWKQRLAGFDIVMEEDTRNMAPMQKSLESPGLTGMPISYQERRIWNCAEQLDRMIGPERIPEDLRVAQLLGPYLER